MKEIKFCLLVIVLLFFSCKNEKSTTAATPTSNTTTAPLTDEAAKIAESSMDFWSKNNFKISCTSTYGDLNKKSYLSTF